MTGIADGTSRGEYTTKDEASSPTVLHEAITVILCNKHQGK
jgi:hypothetical protein